MRAWPFRRYLRWAAAGMFGAAGVAHFLSAASFAKIVPPYVPQPLGMVYFTGAAEIAGALGLLWQRFRKPAAYGLIALLVCVFPANLYMAMNNISPTATPIPQWVLWARLPLQAVLIWWVFVVRR